MTYQQLLAISMSLNVFQALVIAFLSICGYLALFRPKLLLRVIRKVFPLVLVLCFVPVPSASAHDWYPPECCSGKDCSSVPCGELDEDGNGHVHYTTPGGTKILIPKSRVMMSQDDKCHICYYRAEDRRYEINGYCAFLQYGN